MAQKCEICKHACKLVQPSIFKCNRNGKTVMFDDWCEYWEENKDIWSGKNDDDVINFFNDIFKGNKK